MSSGVPNGISRRNVMAGAAVALTAAALPASAQMELRGSLNAAGKQLVPNTSDDQSALFQTLLDEASATEAVVALPAGNFRLGAIRLPTRTRIQGVTGATRLIFAGGGGSMFSARDAETISLSGLILDGAAHPFGDDTEALVDLRRPGTISISDCSIVNSARSALIVEDAQGHITRCTLTLAVEFGLWAIGSRGLTIADNRVTDCGDGGILVHRREIGPDATIVRGNHVARIAARSGGTGQFGNGVNLFRAAHVQVTGNTIEDCAFTAIRANSASGAIITGNTCLRSGETGLYAEFQFEGAIIANNLVDGAANGISVVNFNEGGRVASVTGNIVRNLKTSAPYPADPPGFGTGIAVEAETVVSANVVEGATLYGIHIGWGEFMRNVVTTGNVIRDCATGIALTVVEGTGPAVITDNIIAGARNGAVVGYRWADAATGDLTREPQDLPGITIERNRAG